MRLTATIRITGPSHNPMQMAANTAVFKSARLLPVASASRARLSASGHPDGAARG